MQSIGNYDILSKIGEGGMGIVYRAVHRKTGELVALKTVLAPSNVQLSSLRREIYTLAEVNHPGIIKIREEGLQSGIPWFAMELLDGNTLREVLAEEDSQFSFIEIINIIRQVCISLAYLHGEGILHLDLKPENIFITRDNTPKLLDFGLVSRFMSQPGREASDLGQYGVGTLEYMAPELILGQFVDARADLYSVGCILYEIIAGQTPYQDEDVSMIIRQQFETGYQPLSEIIEGIPEALLDLIDRLLQPNPGKRMGYAMDVAATLNVGLPESPSYSTVPDPRSYLYRPGFIGRDNIIEQMNQYIRSFQDGNGAMVLLGGEAGIGKTRIAIEIGRHVQSMNHPVLVGGCQPSLAAGKNETAQHSELFQALKKPMLTIYDYCREQGPAVTRKVIGDRNGILAHYGLSPLDTDESEDDFNAELFPPAEIRIRIFRMISQVMCAFIDIKPSILILDDLQWADELTLGFLKYLADSGRLNHRKLLVIGTFRFEDVQLPLRDLIASPTVNILKLKGLGSREVGSMVMDMLALNQPAPNFFRYLSLQSSGNPFFVAEYLKSSVEDGFLYRNTHGEWCFKSGEQIHCIDDGEIHVPSSLREILLGRIQQLSPEIRRCIEVFSVLGVEADARILKDVSGKNEVDIMVCLQDLLTRQVIEETDPGLFRFVHDQVRIVIYEDMLGERRVPLHLKAIESLKRAESSNKMRTFAEMAYHLEMARDLIGARSFYLSSARLAVQKIAILEAKKLYKKYFKLLNGHSPESIMVRLEYCRNIMSDQHNLQDLAETLESVLEAAREIGYKKAEADALNDLAAIVWQLGRQDDAWSMGMEALTIYRARQDRRSEAGALYNLGIAADGQGHHVKAVASFQQAIEVFRALGDRVNESRVITDLGMAFMGLGNQWEGLKLLNQSLSIQNAAGDVLNMGRTYECLGEAARKDKRPAQAIQYLEKAMLYHEKVMNRSGEGRVLAALSTLYHEAGEYEKAMDSGHEAITVFSEQGDYRSVAGIQFRFAEFQLTQGNLDESRRLFEDANKIFDELNDLELKGKSLRYISKIFRWSGTNLNEADDLAHESDCIFRKLGNIIEIIDCLFERACVAFARGVSGREHYEEARNLAQKNRLLEHSRCSDTLLIFKTTLALFESGGKLVCGECPEYLPASQLD